MRLRASMAALALVATVGAAPAAAQQPAAEVRTWSGQSWRLADPTLHVFYDVFETADARQGPTADALPPPPSGAPLELRGSLKALSTFLQAPPVSRVAERPVDAVRVFKEGTEVRVPLGSVEALRFIREPVARSPLPPYVAPSHFRHSVIVVLRDGSRLEADYVNWGTAILRGSTPQGRLEIPWGEIEMVRFLR